MKINIPKVPLIKQVHSYLPVDSVNQHSLRQAIRQVLHEQTRTRIVPLIALSLAGLAPPLLAQQATFELSSLDGSNGFLLKGVFDGDESGRSVSAAGDVNDDGIDDLLIGAPSANANSRASGASYVVFGASEVGSDGAVELSALDGSNGFVLNGVFLANLSGGSVSAAGDVNGDGVDDLLIGARFANSNGKVSGTSYVVFGAKGVGTSGVVELSSLDGSNGFKLNGLVAGDLLGKSVSAAGDVNDDGIDDLLIGASGADPNGGLSGASYVVFGAREVGNDGMFTLSALDGSNGFVLNGVAADDGSGGSVSAAGDINGDGVDDLLIGARGADPNGFVTGASYVVFGNSGVGSGGAMELSTLDGSNGFVLNGVPTSDNSNNSVGDYSGYSVSEAGDVNGDGVDDLLIGAHGADPNGDRSGASYVVFGASGVGSGGSVELSTLDGDNGFVLNGVAENDFSGRSLSTAGDVNDDGVDDLLIGAIFAAPNGQASGASYLVFGAKEVGNNGIVELSALDGSNGFVLNGSTALDFSGHSVSAAGDVNGDGVDDLLIGAYGADPNGARSGASYVVFGEVTDNIEKTTLDIPVSASSDDAEESIATDRVKPGSSDLEFGNQGKKNQLVGVRFKDLDIPHGATITNAYIQFQADETHSGATTLMIEGQATDNAVTFTNVNANISSRDRTNTLVDWNPNPWTTVGDAGADQQTPDIASVIQEIVDRPGWSSGNALAIIITGSGRRTAESYDGDVAGAPVLHVEYTSTPVIVESRVATSFDDAEESVATGNVKPGSSDLEFGDQGRKNQLVGMRFNDLNIPQGVTITNASIQFKADETNSGTTALMIEGQATDNATMFTRANDNISSRERTNAVVDWAPAPWTTAGEAGPNQQTPDISSIIQEIVNRPGWSGGNSLAIIITGIGRRTAESFDGDADGAPVLHVEYQ